MKLGLGTLLLIGCDDCSFVFATDEYQDEMYITKEDNRNIVSSMCSKVFEP
jgi:hypothetical protein